VERLRHEDEHVGEIGLFDTHGVMVPQPADGCEES
jgi:hypothetical protein